MIQITSLYAYPAESVCSKSMYIIFFFQCNPTRNRTSNNCNFIHNMNAAVKKQKQNFPNLMLLIFINKHICHNLYRTTGDNKYLVNCNISKTKLLIILKNLLFPFSITDAYLQQSSL